MRTADAITKLGAHSLEVTNWYFECLVGTLIDVV